MFEVGDEVVTDLEEKGIVVGIDESSWPPVYEIELYPGEPTEFLSEWQLEPWDSFLKTCPFCGCIVNYSEIYTDAVLHPYSDCPGYYATKYLNISQEVWNKRS